MPRPIPAARTRGVRRGPAAAGFTLLEVMIAMAILGLAVVASIQLVSQSLRLLKLSGDHQQAAVLADRLVRETPPGQIEPEEGVEGPFAWARRVTAVSLPKEFVEAEPAAPGIATVEVSVRWGGRVFELRTLRLDLVPPVPVAR
jgi:general secretion pathway protein I